MVDSAGSALPSLGEVLAPVLERVPRAQQPLFVALAERMAAERYRGWAAAPDLAGERKALLACAAREIEIAERIEALHADAEAVQAGLMAENPGLEELNRSLFADRPVRDQMTMQARGERLGAATWRSFARDARGAAVGVFEACAKLEEESAAVLERILAVPA